jgi:hypothetical protein
MRAILLDHLMDLEEKRVIHNEKSEWSDLGKLDAKRIKYSNISKYGRYKYFRPCLKRYKYSQIKSRMIQLSQHEWDTAIMLPVAKFVGATQKEVWKDSRAIIKKH